MCTSRARAQISPRLPALACTISRPGCIPTPRAHPLSPYGRNPSYRRSTRWGSYLSNSALHVPLSCGRCALRQPSIPASLPIELKQSRITSPPHDARFSASEGPAANPAVANKANATTDENPSAHLRILFMASPSVMIHCNGCRRVIRKWL
jgi:hypothetical protein